MALGLRIRMRDGGDGNDIGFIRVVNAATSNIQHSTSNSEQTKERLRSMLCVRCWMFDVLFLSFKPRPRRISLAQRQRIGRRVLRVIAHAPQEALDAQRNPLPPADAVGVD